MQSKKLVSQPGWIFFSTASGPKDNRAEIKALISLCKQRLGRSHGPHCESSSWYYCHSRSRNSRFSNRDSVVIVDPELATEVILTFC